MTHDEGGAVELLNDVRHGKGLAGPCHTEQHLRLRTGLYSFDQRFYRFRLVSGRLVWRFELEQKLLNHTIITQ